MKSANPNDPGPDKIRTYLMRKKNDCEDRQILRSRIVYVYRLPYTLPRWTVYMASPPCNIYRVRYGTHFLIVRPTSVLFQMSQLRAAKRVCKERGTKAFYLTQSCNDVARREWLYRDGAARKVLGDRDFVFGDELTRENLLS